MNMKMLHVKHYTELMKMQHTSFTCLCCGLFVSEQYNFIAATPDGISKCDCCGDGIVEIKCPFLTKDSEPDVANFFENGTLKRSHQYYYQVQTQLYVCGADFGDFVVCTFPNDSPTIAMERLFLDEEFIHACIENATQFFDVAILPELLGRWYTRSLVIPVEMDSTSDYNFCYCKEEKGGEMVCCDNSDCCSGQWFHLSCLKLKSAPRVKKWYCPDCRKQCKPPKSKRQKTC